MWEDPFLAERLQPSFLRLIKSYGELFLKEEQAQLNLLRFMFGRLFRPLYLPWVHKKKGSVFFLSRILPDGIGDFFSLLKSSKYFAERQPFLDVHIACTYNKTLPQIDPKEFALLPENMHLFFEYKNLEILEPLLTGSPIEFAPQLSKLTEERRGLQADFDSILASKGYAVTALQEQITELDTEIRTLQQSSEALAKGKTLYAKMQESLAIVHMALALNTFDNPDFAAKSLYFAEMGNFQGIANALERNWFSMGLHPFEEGIFLKKVRTSSPNEDSHPPMHVGYLQRIPHQLKIFIYLVCLQHKGDKRTIDLILPKAVDEELSLNKAWLKAQGTSIRIQRLLPLPFSDFEKLLHRSQDLMGCTGDGSLADCLSAGKIPFYEMRPHKFEALEAFEQLAKELNLNHVTHYFEIMRTSNDFPPEEVAEKLDAILKQIQFKQEWAILLEILHQNYCFEDALMAIVNRQILFQLHPTLASQEEKLIQDFFAGKISAEAAYKALEQTIRRLS